MRRRPPMSIRTDTRCPYTTRVRSMAAWTLRYLLFAFGAPDLSVSMILMAVILHGICYDFFFVTGFMYTDSKAPASVRGQAQCMLVRSEEHTSELQSLMRLSSAVFCLKKNKPTLLSSSP